MFMLSYFNTILIFYCENVNNYTEKLAFKKIQKSVQNQSVKNNVKILSYKMSKTKVSRRMSKLCQKKHKKSK